jgi:hypothetical protein
MFTRLYFLFHYFSKISCHNLLKPLIKARIVCYITKIYTYINMRIFMLKWLNFQVNFNMTVPVKVPQLYYNDT